MNHSWTTSEKSREYGKNGGAVTRRASTLLIYIDSQPFTYQQIADRLGIGKSAANSRVLAARKKKLPMTWANLGEKS